MNIDKVLTYADHMGRSLAQRYGYPPVTGRVIGYLSVCEPAEQSINDISEALLSSRSAINNALKMLEAQKLIIRTRPAGTRADLVSLSPVIQENAGFEPDEYLETARLAREGLALLEDAPPERRQPLEAAASLGDFLAERLPQLYEEWKEYHNNALAAKNKEK
ncbi:MAG TPA: helix-turn-helix domain-containing protein [Candidatus Saccharimonadales bacterium]|nr:helix-turn-helix domain-containing protein [Candidatus Saccharimonadales bacterium]